MRSVTWSAEDAGTVRRSSVVQGLRGCVVGLCLLVMLGGCKDDGLEELTWEDIDRPTAAEHLGRFTRSGPVEGRERATLALAKLNDDVIDEQPIMIRTLLTRESDGFSLRVTYWDEDNDIRGFRLKERYEQADGDAVVVEEEYPVFINDLRPPITGTGTFTSIRTRESPNDRKDDAAWLRYENQVLNSLVEKCARLDSIAGLSTVIVEAPTPAIYMCVPEPDRVQAEIAVYDRRGNVSDYGAVLFRSDVLE